MDDPSITMEEYIGLEEEKARRRGMEYNWKTATYGKIWDNEDVHGLGSFESEFPAIALNDGLTSEVTLSCKPTVSSLNDNKIDFRISFGYFDDFDFFKDFENEFSAIVYNDAQTSKSDLLTESILSPQHINEIDFKDETSLSECDEEEQNVLNFNDLFPFNVIYPNDSKSDKDNDDDKVDIKQSSGDMSVIPLPDVINTDVNLDNSTSNVLIPLDSWKSRLLVYKEPLSSDVSTWGTRSFESWVDYMSPVLTINQRYESNGDDSVLISKDNSVDEDCNVCEDASAGLSKHNVVNEKSFGNNDDLLLEDGDGLFDSKAEKLANYYVAENTKPNMIPNHSYDIPSCFVLDLNSNQTGVDQELGGAANDPMSICSRPDMHNVKVGCDGMAIDKPDQMNDYNCSQPIPASVDALIQACAYAADHQELDVLQHEAHADEFRDDYMSVLNDEEMSPNVSLDDMKFQHEEENLPIKNTPLEHQPVDELIDAQIDTTNLLPENMKEISRQPKIRSLNKLMTLQVFVENLSRPDGCKKDKVTVLDEISEFLKMQDPPEYQFPSGFQDLTVDRIFWLQLASLDLAKKAGWETVARRRLGYGKPIFLTMHTRWINAWLFFQRYEVYFPVNEPERHWCLAELQISTSVVTFYDTLGWVKGNVRFCKFRPRLNSDISSFCDILIGTPSIFGFGVPPYTLDPTIVKISYPVSGQDGPIVKAATCHCRGYSVQVYNPESDSFNNVTKILGNAGSFYIGPYKESMILATYPDHSHYYAGESLCFVKRIKQKCVKDVMIVYSPVYSVVN
uniref:Phospholipase-like protein n=1 Tax=Tanacetum cinerariifolium TaxID=118510 RepID=A0A6L2J3A3_TANCI|nr:phospholipase-like protein [Tanacetum cinerariifolium]